MQLDGLSPHYAVILRKLLNEQDPNRSIGRGSPIEWPPHTPRLTSPDLFLILGVFEQQPTTREYRSAFQNFTFLKEIAMCIGADGEHFETKINVYFQAKTRF